MKPSLTSKRFWQSYGLVAVAGVLALTTTAAVAYAVGSSTHEPRYGMQEARQMQTRNAGHSSKGRQANGGNAGDGMYQVTPLSTAEASNDPETAKQLAFTIEEEKLAYDVYTAMYDKWGARFFDNISKSEASHQDMVLSVMNSRNLDDPRSKEQDVFTNDDLQKWYDELIAKGNKSLNDAIQVGIEIEEKDIAGLKETITTLNERDTDLKEAYTLLLQASEHHLQAFTRQASRT